jgi:hypothetical protein
MTDVDLAKLRPLAPVVAPVVILAAAWFLLLGPAIARNSRTARDLDAARQRLLMARRAVSGPVPPAVAGDPAALFVRTLAARDATPQLLEQLARRAADATAEGLTIETGEPATVAAASGPQVANQPQPDPRLALFDVSLAYSPITMSFDAEYPQIGSFLWNLRDLATVIDVRSFELRPVPQRTRRLEHVTLTLFAFARQASNPVVVQASARGARR